MKRIAKPLALIAVTLLCLGLTVLLVGWSDIQELRRAKNWQVTAAPDPKGELVGVTVSVDQARAMIVPGKTDRAVVYLRLGLGGKAIADLGWCNVSLTDPKGREWLPLFNEVGNTAIERLGDSGNSGQSCDSSLRSPPEDGGPSFSDQAFLVPVDVLDKLRVELSGVNTRPKAVSLPFKPVLRPPPG